MEEKKEKSIFFSSCATKFKFCSSFVQKFVLNSLFGKKICTHPTTQKSYLKQIVREICIF